MGLELVRVTKPASSVQVMELSDGILIMNDTRNNQIALVNGNVKFKPKTGKTLAEKLYKAFMFSNDID